MAHMASDAAYSLWRYCNMSNLLHSCEMLLETMVLKMTQRRIPGLISVINGVGYMLSCQQTIELFTSSRRKSTTGTVSLFCCPFTRVYIYVTMDLWRKC